MISSRCLQAIRIASQDTEWDRAKAQLGAALVNQVIKAVQWDPLPSGCCADGCGMPLWISCILI